MAWKSVYVMKSGNAYKIGISENPEKRLKDLSIGNCTLDIIYASALIKNARAVELSLHRKFSDFAVGREWFVVDDEKHLLSCVLGVISELGNSSKDTFPENNHPQSMVKENGVTFTLDEWIEKIKVETDHLRMENEELQKFLYCMHGYEIPNIFSDCIYKSLFGMDSKQLHEKYGLKETQCIKDCFTEKELKAVQSMECLVSGLVDCGWEYEQVKAFIVQNNSLRQLAA